MSSSEEAARTERLAAALRENLKRRKAQMRGRKDGAPARPDEASPPADGSADEPLSEAAPPARGSEPDGER